MAWQWAMALTLMTQANWRLSTGAAVRWRHAGERFRDFLRTSDKAVYKNVTKGAARASLQVCLFQLSASTGKKARNHVARSTGLSPGFRSRGGKKSQGGNIFKIQYWMCAATGGGLHEMGGPGTIAPPRWRRPSYWNPRVLNDRRPFMALQAVESTTHKINEFSFQGPHGHEWGGGSNQQM